MSVEKTVTCDRCGKTPLRTDDWHDGIISVGASQNYGGIRYESDLCTSCKDMLRTGLKAFFAGGIVTIKRDAEMMSSASTAPHHGLSR